VSEIPAVRLSLAEPPVVVSQGRATHGVGRLVDEFQLPDLWSLHLYAYAAELEVDGVGYAITPGSVSLVPPGSLIRYRYQGPSTHLYAHLRIGPGTVGPGAVGPGAVGPGAVGEGATWPLHLVMYPGPELAVITDLMESAVDSAVSHPERTRADVWLALLRLAALDRGSDPDSRRRSPAQEHLTRALAYIERHLSEPLTVPEIAAAVGLSHNHLTRLFTGAQGVTVVGYLRQRRIEHARQLLVHSTMSITAIAATVGIPDLQAFNKACRTVTGLGPRALRHAGGVPTSGGPSEAEGSD
jgi:AraC-like DNA-binding protein